MGLFDTAVLAGVALLALGFVVIGGMAAGILVWLVRYRRAHADERSQLLLDLGFAEIGEPFDGLASRLARIHGCRPGVMHIGSARKRNADGAAMYLLSYDRTDDDGTGAASAIALVVPGLDLPTYSIYPKAPATGWAGRVSNRLVQVARHAVGSKAVDTSAYPAFDARYALASREPEAARAALPAALFKYLGTTEWLMLDGAGDTVLVELREPGKTFAQVDRDYLEPRVRHAHQVSTVLQQAVKGVV